MKKAVIFMADGCEEIEGLTVVDLLRRVGIEIDMVSISSSRRVTGSHQITFETDLTVNDLDAGQYDCVILPGGMPGTRNLADSEAVTGTVKNFFSEGRLVAAICAAPTVLGQLGILTGRKATCYPGMEDQLTNAILSAGTVVEDGNLITSRGMGTAIDFSLALIARLKSPQEAQTLSKKIVYQQGEHHGN